MEGIQGVPEIKLTIDDIEKAMKVIDSNNQIRMNVWLKERKNP